MVERLQMPRIDAPTPDGKIQQLNDFIFQLVRTYNYTINELEHEIAQLKKDRG